MFKKGASYFFILVLTIVILAACGKEAGTDQDKTNPGQENPVVNQPQDQPQQQPKEEEKQPKPEPVTLTYYSPNARDTTELFMEQYGNAIEAKFPHITLNFVHSPDTDVYGNLTNRLTANEPIDILANANHYRYITPFKFEYDLTELIRKHNFDLSHLEPNTVEAVKALSDNGEMYALPFRMNNQVLLYNKTLFDKFGVNQPVDHMTWDEAYQLANTMTRKDGDVQYRGFVTQSYSIAWSNQLSLGFADPKTDKPYFYTDDRWAQFVQNINRFYEIPGNALLENSYTPIHNLFFVDEVAAMYASSVPVTEQTVDWDLVTLPEFSHLPGVGSQADVAMVYVSSISNHKDEAFEVIAYMTSDEFQKTISEKALGIPVVKSQEVKDAYGKENPFLQGKNLKALTLNSPALPFEQSPYQPITNNQLEKIWYQLGKGQLDVNTADRKSVV